MTMYRNRKLLDVCHDLPCTWPLEHVCQGAIEPAHSNQIRDGHGRGIKSHDYRVAALCHAAHFEHDQGKALSKQERREAWDEANRRTIGLMFELGKVGLLR